MCREEMKFHQYDVVRVVARNKPKPPESDLDQRPPAVGDIATVLEVYDNPPGYKLECSDSEGITIWLGGFSPDDLSLELVKEDT
jgi:hypothetical protein